jgi:hypothetical protein
MKASSLAYNRGSALEGVRCASVAAASEEAHANCHVTHTVQAMGLHPFQGCTFQGYKAAI